MLPWLLLLLACGPSVSGPPEPSRWWSVSLGSRPIGALWFAERGGDDGRVVWVGQRYAWSLDGAARSVETVGRAEVDRSGAVTRWTRTRDGEPAGAWSGEGLAWLELEALDGRLQAGRRMVLDPQIEGPAEVEIREEEGGFAWTLHGVSTRVEPGPRFRWGGLGAVPVDGEPELEPVDPRTLLRRPSLSHPEARTARFATWRVDGELRTTTAPLELEIPRTERARLERLVRAVRARLTHAPYPGSPDALAALARGSGDCNEFASVFVALAAEQGLEARPVAGLVYTEREGPALDLHAWVEVDLGGRAGWVAVDPALDQPLADAAHLPLAGDRELASAVARISSPIPIELVSVR